MNIFAAVKQLTFVAKLFAAAKLNLEDFITAGDESALAAHIEGQRQAGSSAATTSITIDTVAMETKLLTDAGITVAEGQTPAQALAAHITAVKAAADRQSALCAAMTAAGIKVTEATTVEQFTKALEDRISTRAGEELAKRGVGTAFVKDTPAADPTAAITSPKSELFGLAKVRAALEVRRN